jgi:hypothetical protein
MLEFAKRAKAPRPDLALVAPEPDCHTLFAHAIL